MELELVQPMETKSCRFGQSEDLVSCESFLVKLRVRDPQIPAAIGEYDLQYEQLEQCKCYCRELRVAVLQSQLFGELHRIRMLSRIQLKACTSAFPLEEEHTCDKRHQDQHSQRRMPALSCVATIPTEHVNR